MSPKKLIVLLAGAVTAAIAGMAAVLAFIVTIVTALVAMVSAALAAVAAAAIALVKIKDKVTASTFARKRRRGSPVAFGRPQGTEL